MKSMFKATHTHLHTRTQVKDKCLLWMDAKQEGELRQDEGPWGSVGIYLLFVCHF